MTQPIIDYLQSREPTWQSARCQQVHDLVYQAIPDVEARLQYGKPHYLKNGKYVCVLGTAKGWVSFTIFNATALNAPDGLFEASDTAERRTIKFREGQPVDERLLISLIRQAASTL